MHVTATVLDVVARQARDAWPRECCGVLLGRGDHIEAAVAITNLAGGEGRYLLDPEEHIAARREARRRGVEVIGFYHSHPGGRASPSPTDLAEASYPDHIYLIVAVGRERPAEVESRAYRLSQKGYVELPLVVDAEPG